MGVNVVSESDKVEHGDDRKRDEQFVKNMAEVLSGFLLKVGSRVASSFHSVMYFTSFDKKVIKAHIRRAGDSRRTEKACKLELIVENGSFHVEYYFEER